MKLSEFKHQPRGPRLFEHWISDAQYESPLGLFDLELQTGIDEQPDEIMLQEAAKVAQEFEQFALVVAEKVFEHYTRAQSEDGWLESCGVPTDLSLWQLAPYLESRSLVVARDVREDETEYQTSIYISPAWDTEHGIYLDITAQGLEFA